MRLNELKEKVDVLCGGGYGENEVVVALSGRTFGVPPFARIASVFLGIDWEDGQIRIEPDRPIIERDKDRDIPVARIESEIVGGHMVYVCPACGGYVQKCNDRYCPRCGQRLAEARGGSGK